MRRLKRFPLLKKEWDDDQPRFFMPSAKHVRDPILLIFCGGAKTLMSRGGLFPGLGP